MKLEIFKNELPDKEPVLLRLHQRAECVEVIVVDEAGDRKDRGTLLTIKSAGVHLQGTINPTFGFALDSDNRLIRT